MPVAKITSAEFQARIRAGITSRNASHDTAYGPIPDIIVNPMAAVLEEQNDRLRDVSLLLSLSNVNDLDSDDVEAIVFNEGMLRLNGAFATGNVIFRRRSAPSRDAVVARGYAIATSPDEATGASVTFVVSEAKTLYTGTGLNTATGYYELEVPVVALTEGVDGVVGVGRINRPLRPLVDFDSVTNTAPTSGGRDVETNAELVERYLIAVLGTQLNTPLGVERFVRDNYADVQDAHVVYGADIADVRGTAGAVDAVIVGEQALALTEQLAFVGVGQVVPVTRPPLLSVSAVETYVEGTDYEVVFDDSGLAGTTRAVDGIRFLAGGSAPQPGATFSATYTYDQLTRNIQSAMEERSVACLGRDLLIKRGVRVDIYLDARLKVVSGFNPTTIQGLVEDAIDAFVNTTLGLDDNVERSDLQGEVRALAGVDNFIVDRLVRVATDVGATDLTIAPNEYPRIDAVNRRITLI